MTKYNNPNILLIEKYCHLDTKIKFGEIVCLIIFNLIYFQCALMLVSDIFSYIDEILMIFCIPFAIHSFIKKGDKFSIKFFIALLIYSLVSFASNFRSGINNNLFSIILAFALFLRNFIIFIAFYKSTYLTKNFVRIRKIIVFEIKTVSIVALIFCLINFFSPISYMGYDYRFGIHSFSFIFNHPGNFSNIVFFNVLFLYFYSYKFKNIFIFINLILLFSSLRFNSFLMIFVLLMLFLYRTKKINNSTKIIVFSFFLIITFIVCLPQFITYFGKSSDAPRALFYRYAVVTANTYFPFGSGFGTFGSFVAGDYYSELYYEYGFQYLYGLDPVNGLFLYDNFWPMIIGESGIFGFVVFVYLIILLFKKSIKNIDLLSFIIILELLIQSIFTPSFVHFNSILFFIMIGVSFNFNENKKLFLRSF